MPARPRVLFLVTEDRFFWSHRLPLARAALRNGYEVIVATRVSSYAERIRAEGFRLIPLRLIRESYSPLKELRAIHQLRKIYAAERPDIVHQVALKPVLYGSIAALGHKETKVINALTGLGYLVASSSLKARALRMVVWSAFKFLLNRPNCRVLLQNQDDRELLIAELRMRPEKVALIRGSGVDVDFFQPAPEPAGTPVILLASRMLWNKGIKEFVEAASLLRGKGIAARFVLAGDTDSGSPSAIPRQQLLEWQASGEVEWWGHRADMVQVFQEATLVCIPSHREGIPKALLEAAASGRAIVTTDVPGCRDIVRQGVNGLLVPAQDVAALAGAIERLLQDPGLRVEMAHRGREIAVNEFSQQAVVDQTLELYRELLTSSSRMTAAAGLGQEGAKDRRKY